MNVVLVLMVIIRIQQQNNVNNHQMVFLSVLSIVICLHVLNVILATFYKVINVW